MTYLPTKYPLFFHQKRNAQVLFSQKTQFPQKYMQPMGIGEFGGNGGNGE